MDRTKRLVNGLNTYHGRDACIKSLQFFTLFLYGYFEEYYSGTDSFLTLSKQFSNCRIILRLLEDLPAIYNFLSYLSIKDKHLHNSNFKVIKLTNLTFWISYNIFEHIAWLSELSIIEANSKKWWSITFASWACGLITGIILNLRLIYQYYATENKNEIKKKYSEKFVKIRKDEFLNAVLFLFRDLSDLIIAVHLLPAGFLWSSYLVNYQIGILGTFAGLCRVYTFVWTV